MSPIRVGIIGLSARAKTSWAGTAHLPYLQTFKERYVIIALCNSSVSAARSAIETYNLPASTKAYGNPVDLANDDEVELVVCNTRVDVHYETIKPSLMRGKNVYCEWPLAANLESAQELASIAKEKGSKTIIGLQGQLSPVVLKLKSLIDDERRIGKVLSSSVVAFGGVRTPDSVIEPLKYFTQREVGGNMVTIGFAHMMDYVGLVLGELSSFTSQLSIQRPQVDIKGSNDEVIETVTSNVADHIMLHGTLISGAPLSVIFRRGQAFKGDPSLTWLIHGEKGEVKLTAAAVAMQASDDGISIAVHDFGKDEVENVPWIRPFENLPGRARNVAELYEAYADGNKQRYPDFTHAVLRHAQIDQVLRNSEERKTGVYL